MTFKDLKSGFPVYLLDRTALTYEQGRVMSVGMPRADLQTCNYGKMYVDITIQSGGKQNTYSVCEALLAELDTAYKDRQATETRFQRIDERFSGMESKTDRILEAMGRKEGE